MTDSQDTTPATNGTGGGKRKIAIASFDGSTGRLTFANGAGELVINGDDMPNSGLLAAYGAVAALQNAYANADDPFAAAQTAYNKLMAGTWTPGPPRREAQVDSLVQALQEHLSHETKKGLDVITPDYVTNKYIPAYQANHNLNSVGHARRLLRAHPDIARRVAEIDAARSKAVAEQVRRSPKESLVLDV